MRPIAISSTQPCIGYAYAAIQIQGTERSGRTVLYRGFSQGRHILEIEEGTYKGTRVSDDESEPAFEFNVTDVIR